MTNNNNDNTAQNKTFIPYGTARKGDLIREELFEDGKLIRAHEWVAACDGACFWDVTFNHGLKQYLLRRAETPLPQGIGAMIKAEDPKYGQLYTLVRASVRSWVTVWPDPPGFIANEYVKSLTVLAVLAKGIDPEEFTKY